MLEERKEHKICHEAYSANGYEFFCFGFLHRSLFCEWLRILLIYSWDFFLPRIFTDFADFYFFATNFTNFSNFLFWFFDFCHEALATHRLELCEFLFYGE